MKSWTFSRIIPNINQTGMNSINFPKLRQKAKLAAISTTSGTATEVTAFSVITDYSTGVKYPLADFEITPDIAILDPELVEKMPKGLVANTGMDALTHAVEAYVATEHSHFTDPLAIRAIQLVNEHLENSYNGDKNAREQMHYAQCLAGQAFSNALLGIVHSMAHKTGAAFEGEHIIHGMANAIYLPYVIQYNAKDPGTLVRYGDIGRSIGFEGSDEEVTEAFIGRINELNDAFEIPHSLQEWGVPEGEFLEKVGNIAKLAVEDACTPTNPRKIDDANMEKLLKYIYYGKKVDF